MLAVQGFISSAFLAFILMTSNPFARLSPAPFEGRDLNPVLQDLGLAIHPPLLYLGYVGFSIVFSFAAAALIEGRIDAAWARFVRPFALTPTFASDPSRGVFILAILALFIGGALGLFAWRAPLLKRGGLFAPVSREGALVLNNLLLTTTCAGVLIGTLYPLALEQLTGEKITVGAPFFNMTCGVLLLMLCFVVPFGQSLAWKRGDLVGVAQRLSVALAAGLCVCVALFAMLRGGPVLAPIAAGLAIYIILGSLSEIFARVWRRGASFGLLLSRARGLPLSAWGSALAHIGVGLTLMGLAATAFGAETIATMRVGEPQSVGPYEVTFQTLGSRAGPNYSEVVAKAEIRSGGTLVATVEPAKRFFPARQSSTTQAGIATLWLGQLYISLGDQAGDSAVAARLYWKPLVTLIWLGACVMAFGGALSLADRRLRIGAPAPARTAPAQTMAAG